MKNKELKMTLPSADDLFAPISSKDIFSIEKAVPIPIDKLFDFPNHPFKVQDNEEMREMAKSIKDEGIVQPLIVRPRKDGNYEIISGHRRKMASKIANLKELPCIIRDMTDDEAVIRMVNSNMQREKILPSEKAFAYKMKLEAEKRQGQRTDLTSVQNEQKLDNKTTRQKIAEELGESESTVQRYIRLTELIPDLLKLVDEERIAFTPAVDISYLPEDYQYVLLNIYEYSEQTPNVSQARHLKMLSQEGKLTTEKIEEIMEKPKANQIERYKFNRERIESLLPKTIQSDKQAEDFIVQCIKEHNEREKRRNERTR